MKSLPIEHIVTSCPACVHRRYNCETQCPMPVPGDLEEVVQVASHPDGKHFLALTLSGKVRRCADDAMICSEGLTHYMLDIVIYAFYSFTYNE